MFVIITLKDATTGKELQVELPSNEPMNVLLPELARILRIEDVEELQLQNKSQGFDYLDLDTLQQRNTLPNDVCILKYETIQGAWD